MPFAITLEQRIFFEQHQFIELEGVLPVPQVETLQKEGEKGLCQKLGVPSQHLASETTAQLFLAGYHLHLLHGSIKRVTHKSSLATLLSELTQIPTLRFGFDQYILMTHGVSPLPDRPLAETCCLSPLAGAFILPLKELEAPLEFFPMPQKLGNILFLSPTLPIPWSRLCNTPDLCFLLVGLAVSKTLFREGTPDPLSSELKKLGYAFNGALKEPMHPLLKQR
jgi:hypothetical protein